MKKTIVPGMFSLLIIVSSLFTGLHVFAEEVAEENVASTTDSVVQEDVQEEVASSTDPVVPDPDPVSIHLRIEAPNTTLYNSDILVQACKAPEATATTTNAYCAIQQTGLDTTWSPSSFGLFLSRINTFDGSDGNFWGWFQDGEPGMTSLDTHILTSGEKLMLTYGVNPIKLTSTTSSIPVAGTTTLSFFNFTYDASFNPVYLPLEASTLTISSSTETLGILEVASSTFDFSTTTPGFYTFVASKTGYAESYGISVLVYGSSTEATTTATTTDNTGGTGGGSGGGCGTCGGTTQPTFNLTNALQYLISKQHDDGSFGNSLYTDWAAIALGSANTQAASTAKEKIKQYLTTTIDTYSVVTDYERHAMALMALGINPYDGTQVDYIKKITDSFDGTQIGDATIYNDDIFALFPLMKTGYTAQDEIIKKSVAFILSKQNANGSWVGVDLTAAAIQALSQPELQSQPGVSTALINAKNYLKSAQANGGFGTSFATSWTLQAITSLNETNNQWSQNNQTPLHYLSSFQQSDGGVENSTDENTRIWATAYAIPAANSKSWPMLLTSFARPASSPNTNGTPNNSDSTTQPQATTTAATSSPQIATTTATTTLAQKPSLPALKPVTPIRRIAYAPQTKVESSLQSTTTEKISRASSTPNTTSEATTSQTQIAAAQSATPRWPFVTGALGLALVAIGYGIFRKVN